MVFQSISRGAVDNAPLNFHECNIYRVNAITVAGTASLPYTFYLYDKNCRRQREYTFIVSVFFYRC
jgi:hypothetical protein